MCPGLNTFGGPDDEDDDAIVADPQPVNIKEQAKQRWVEEILNTGIFFGDEEARMRLTQVVAEQDSCLGFGGAAAVFDIGDKCVKIMRNRWQVPNTGQYDLGRNPKDEAKIQGYTNDLTVDGVHAPRVFSHHFSANQQLSAIYMEKLDAIELTDITSGDVPAPPNFDPEEFIDRLQAYVYALHDDLGIIHCDLAPRNVMVDRKTGYPRVIDFGRAVYYPQRPPGFDRLTMKDEKGMKEIADALGVEYDIPKTN